MPRNIRKNQKIPQAIHQDYPPLDSIPDANIAAILPLIHQILSQVGMRISHLESIELLTKQGAIYDGARLTLPTKLIEQVMANWHHHLPFGLNNAHRNYFLGGKAKFIGTTTDKKIRPATLDDAVQAIKIADKLPLISVICQPIILSIPLNILAPHLIQATDKPVLLHCNLNENIGEFLTIAQNYPQCGLVMPNILSPLSVDSDIIGQFSQAITRKIPVFCETHPIAGATAPVNLYAATAQALSEVIFMKILAHCLNPDTPIMLGVVPSIMDLKIGSMTMGAVECGLFAKICTQTARYFNIPIYIGAGGTDAKYPECQAGLEKAQNLGQLNHAHHIKYWGGSLANGQVFSPEYLYIDYELIANHKRLLCPEPPINDANIAEITAVIAKKTHFMATQATRDAMNHFHYPQLLDRNSLGEYEKMNGETAIDYAWHKIWSVH